MQSLRFAFQRASEGAKTPAALRALLPAGPALIFLSLLPSPTLAQEADGSEIYQRHCTVCHGAEGRGDGPASRAFNPPPPDLSDPENMGEMTDAELFQVLAAGRRSMPAFQAVLEPEVLDELVVYLRVLSAGVDSSPGESPDP